jgi:hypothetical protein
LPPNKTIKSTLIKRKPVLRGYDKNIATKNQPPNHHSYKNIGLNANFAIFFLELKTKA